MVLFKSVDTYRGKYETGLFKELSAIELGCHRVVISPWPELGWAELCHYVVDFGAGLDLVNNTLSPVLVIPAQVMGLFKSLELGLMPDTPSRKRVITRIVEGVTIYPYHG